MQVQLQRPGAYPGIRPEAPPDPARPLHAHLLAPTRARAQEDTPVAGWKS